MPSQKPTFDTGGGGWVDPDYFPLELRSELALLAQPALAADEAHAFVGACAHIAHMVLDGRREQTFRESREQLLLVADKAKELMGAMRRLQPSAISDVHANEAHPMSCSANSPVQWSEFARDVVRGAWPKAGLLSCSWELVEALEATARHAADRLPLTNQGPDRWAAEALASQVVQMYARRFGRLPPKDQAGWFVAFMQRLGEHFSLQCGPRPVRSAIEEAERITASS